MKKRLKGTFGEIEVSTPRDRAGTFEPMLVSKRQTRLGDFEDKILALYARGLSTRDIESALVDLYGVSVSHDVVARVTDAVLGEVQAWQERPLDGVYPVVWLDGIVLRSIGTSTNSRSHRTSGIRPPSSQQGSGLVSRYRFARNPADRRVMQPEVHSDFLERVGTTGIGRLYRRVAVPCITRVSIQGLPRPLAARYLA